MADDRIDQFENLPSDWATVAAVGLVAYIRFGNQKTPVRELLNRLDAGAEDLDCDLWCADRALREAHEAGLRERIDVLDCDACGERHMTERGAAMASENRELRRELAARRAVDGWLRENGDRYLEVGVLSGRLNACEGLMRLVASAPTYPALATALGLEVEDE